MSHITAVKTTITDLDILEEALAGLGLSLEREAHLRVRDYYGESVTVEARIPLGKYALGVRRGIGGAYELVGDFWGVAKECNRPRIRAACTEARNGASIGEVATIASRAITRLLARPYAVAAARREIARNPRYRGFQVTEEKNEAGDVVRLALARRIS